MRRKEQPGLTAREVAGKVVAKVASYYDRMIILFEDGTFWRVVIDKDPYDDTRSLGDDLRKLTDCEQCDLGLITQNAWRKREDAKRRRAEKEAEKSQQEHMRRMVEQHGDELRKLLAEAENDSKQA